MPRIILGAVLFLVAGNTVALAQQAGQMSLLQAILVVSRDVFVKKCPQHVALTDKAKHDAELDYVKKTLTPEAGENSYAAIRKRIEPGYNGNAACDRELSKHKAQTYPAYTYSNITLRK